MVNVFVKLIINHRKDIDDVPINIRDEVMLELKRQGYDEHGNKIINKEVK